MRQAKPDIGWLGRGARFLSDWMGTAHARRRLRKMRDAAGPSFDEAFYRRSNPDAAAAGMPLIDHYLLYGWREGRDPSPHFSTLKYLAEHPSSGYSGSNPLYHALCLARGGRPPSRRGRRPKAPGALTSMSGEACSGWVAANSLNPQPLVFVFADGAPYMRLVAHGDKARPRFSFAPPVSRIAREFRIRVECDGAELEGSPFPMKTQPIGGTCDDEIADRRAVAIIVPVFNAFEAVRECLAALDAHTPAGTDIIIIDDASTDSRLAPLLRCFARNGRARLIFHEQNRGYTRTVNEGMGLAAGSDAVLLNSDAIIGPRWLDNLRDAAHSGARVGTATALSDNAGAFSAPEIDIANSLPPGFSGEEYQRAVMEASDRLLPETPTGNGFCLYIRRACLDETGLFDEEAFPRGYGEENDFCMRASRAGWRHVVDDRTLALHRGSASFGEARFALQAAGRAAIAERYPEFQGLVDGFRACPAMATARWRIRALHRRPVSMAKT